MRVSVVILLPICSLISPIVDGKADECKPPASQKHSIKMIKPLDDLIAPIQGGSIEFEFEFDVGESMEKIAFEKRYNKGGLGEGLCFYDPETKKMNAYKSNRLSEDSCQYSVTGTKGTLEGSITKIGKCDANAKFVLKLEYDSSSGSEDVCATKMFRTGMGLFVSEKHRIWTILTGPRAIDITNLTQGDAFTFTCGGEFFFSDLTIVKAIFTDGGKEKETSFAAWEQLSDQEGSISYSAFPISENCYYRNSSISLSGTVNFTNNMAESNAFFYKCYRGGQLVAQTCPMSFTGADSIQGSLEKCTKYHVEGDDYEQTIDSAIPLSVSVAVPLFIVVCLAGAMFGGYLWYKRRKHAAGTVKKVNSETTASTAIASVVESKT